VSAWLALVLTDAIAVVTFARCFTGPGELTAALAGLVLAHLSGLAARGGLSTIRADDLIEPGRAGGSSSGSGTAQGFHDRRQRGLRSGWWALGLVLAVFVPIGIVLGPSSLWVAPHGTWHTMLKDLQAAWTAFFLKVAPVPELPGLVLSTAWAAGAAGLLAELISSRRRIPAVFSLVPALGLYLFAAALGTDSWRVLGLSSMAGSACWYLVAAVREREPRQEVLVASSDTGLSSGERATSYDGGAVMLRMAVLAALAATVVGLNLPGARSVALVAWHGSAGAGSGAATSIPGANLAQGVEISTLVQVAEEEVDNPSGSLFAVHTSTPTREMIAALDHFNGNSWSATSTEASTPLRSFSPPLGADEHEPPPVIADGPGHERLVQVFEMSGLVGYRIPSWGSPVAVAGPGRMSREVSGGSIVSDTEVRPGSVYAVDSIVADPSPAQLEASHPDISDPRDLQLPQPVPTRLVRLASSLVAGATTAYQKALDLEAYLTSPKFHYRLPGRTKSGTVAPPPGYGGLTSFLFRSRTGYCQQFATAFAVLARIEGLPTRIAVGFLPGTPVGHDAWQIDGSDTHAWPQVRFESYGWIDFEPTPGTNVKGSSAPVLPTTPTATTVPVAAPTTSGSSHNLRPAPGRGAATPGVGRQSGQAHRSHALSVAWLLVLPVGVLFWAGSLLLRRRSRLRRLRREPRASILATWDEALSTLDLAGIRRRRAETYLELATRVTSTRMLSEEATLAFWNLALIVTAVYYAGSPPGDFVARQATRDARTVVRSARRRIAGWQRVAAALDPRGLPA
jgi:transglutaminase-like putative cysteine protease